MKLFPAIDLLNGQCVRLYQGDYNQATTYSSDPVAVVREWQDAGASWLHVVDLDGAKVGQPVNSEVIARICHETHLRVELGGGLRTLEQIAETLAMGVERVILGTAVLTDRELLDQALQRWGARIVVGIDARDGYVAIRGWQETSSVQATELAKELSAAGVRTIIYTDIARDSAMQGPNLAALRTMLAALQGSGTALVASGGVSSLADLQSLNELELEGAIIGKALYIGAIDLQEAIRVIERGETTGERAC